LITSFQNADTKTLAAEMIIVSF